MIQTYYGNGKGKTTAAVGSAIRCAGCGNKILFVEFLKNNDSSEFRILEKINGIEVLFSDQTYKLFDNLNSERTQVFANAYGKLVFKEVKNKAKDFDMIILDEILDVIDFGYINEDELVLLFTELKDHTEIILTGHKITQKISDISDYLSCVNAVNHPYSKGVLPRKGIEF